MSGTSTRIATQGFIPKTTLGMATHGLLGTSTEGPIIYTVDQNQLVLEAQDILTTADGVFAIFSWLKLLDFGTQTRNASITRRTGLGFPNAGTPRRPFNN